LSRSSNLLLFCVWRAVQPEGSDKESYKVSLFMCRGQVRPCSLRCQFFTGSQSQEGSLLLAGVVNQYLYAVAVWREYCLIVLSDIFGQLIFAKCALFEVRRKGTPSEGNWKVWHEVNRSVGDGARATILLDSPCHDLKTMK
jgi:hypothetical protein